MAVEIIMPQLGLTMTEGTITRWFKQVGEPVKIGELFFEVATDKITNQIEATSEGILLEIKVPEGKAAPVKSVLATIGEKGEIVTESASSGLIEKPHVQAALSLSPQQVVAAENQTLPTSDDGWVKASPAARKLAAEMNIDLSCLNPTGPGGMVVEKDVLALNWIKASPAARKAAKENSIDLSSVTPSGPDGRIVEQDVLGAADKMTKAPKTSPLAAKLAQEQGVQLTAIKTDGRIMKDDVQAALNTTQPVPAGLISGLMPQPIIGMRKVIAERMSLSWQSAPHVHLTVEVDMSAAISLKDKFAAKTGQKASITEIVVKCAAQALRENPVVNARIAENQIVFSDAVNIGVAVALDNGLIVPVIREADRKSIREIREIVVDYGKRARAGQLMPDEITGGTFTVTNLGMFGTDHFTPVINPPESAILGVCRTIEKPVALSGSIVIRPICNFVLGFDHRIIDGAVGAQFMSRLRDLIENPALLLID